MYILISWGHLNIYFFFSKCAQCYITHYVMSETSIFNRHQVYLKNKKKIRAFQDSATVVEVLVINCIFNPYMYSPTMLDINTKFDISIYTELFVFIILLCRS